MDEFTALAIEVCGGEVSPQSADGMLLDVPVGDGKVQMPLKEMFTKFGNKPQEEIRAMLTEVYQSVSNGRDEKQQENNFSLMIKNDTYWDNALKEAQRADSAARPICR
eukprot:CAMPEP_0118949382 /NCGR_PEP_ID=MMETSP1169-20130426/49525_1 /TAXON_ID=36882 /ORGANISM="Pyramimonas obovata, Strain CCMP722" /LENGTH=107 /DNA_ID=CAMNT_0006896001 /DNA_START=81 /DNA_END=400 /DNA_ORIENTATION=+